ncbi:MAG: hypothetical protein ACRDS9_27705 [Pseudonocardiaceae bacterium]
MMLSKASEYRALVGKDGAGRCFGKAGMASRRGRPLQMLCRLPVAGRRELPQPDVADTALGPDPLDEALQLGVDVVVAEGERGAQEARQRHPRVFSDQRRQHSGPFPRGLASS